MNPQLPDDKVKVTNSRLRWLFVAVLSVCAICLLSAMTKSCGKTYTGDADSNDAKAVLENKVKAPVISKDSSGYNHAEKHLSVASRSAIELAYKAENDSMRRLLKIKDAQILSFTGIGTENKGTIVPEVEQLQSDTGRIYDMEYADRWIKLKGQIGGQENTISYQVYDSLAVVVYEKGGGLFKTATPYINVYSLNPNVTVKGLSGYQLPVNKPGRFGIGPYIGYGYSFGHWAPNCGISLSYQLIRF